MKKKLMFICSIFVLILIVACGRNGTPDTSNFELAPDLLVNQKLDGLVTMHVEIESGTLIETIENHTDFLIGLDFPEIEYFDGENWRIIPTNEDFAFPAILEMISNNDSLESRFNLDYYIHPRQGRFRFRRRVFPDLYPSKVRDYHDLVVEFLID